MFIRFYMCGKCEKYASKKKILINPKIFTHITHSWHSQCHIMKYDYNPVGWMISRIDCDWLSVKAFGKPNSNWNNMNKLKYIYFNVNRNCKEFFFAERAHGKEIKTLRTKWSVRKFLFHCQELASHFVHYFCRILTTKHPVDVCYYT